MTTACRSTESRVQCRRVYTLCDWPLEDWRLRTMNEVGRRGLIAPSMYAWRVAVVSMSGPGLARTLAQTLIMAPRMEVSTWLWAIVENVPLMPSQATKGSIVIDSDSPFRRRVQLDVWHDQLIFVQCTSQGRHPEIMAHLSHAKATELPVVRAIKLLGTITQGHFRALSLVIHWWIVVIIPAVCMSSAFHG